MKPEEMRAALFAAFAELEVVGEPGRLHRVVDELACVGRIPTLSVARQQVVRRSLRWAGRAASAHELERLATTTQAQIDATEALHAPAVTALANAGVANIKDESFLEDQRQLVAKARAAKLLLEDVGLKRPRDLRPQMIAGLIAAAYEDIFGRHVDQPNQSPGLEGLVGKVFGILSIRATAKAAVRAALKARQEFAKEKIAS